MDWDKNNINGIFKSNTDTQSKTDTQPNIY